MFLKDINNTMMFSIISLVYVVFFGIVFLKKEKIKSVELDIFKGIIVTNIISLLTECSIVVCMISNSIFLNIVLKFFNCIIFTYILLIGIYTFTLLKKVENIKSKKNINSLFLVLYFIICFVLLILPVELNNVPYMQYSYGPSVSFLFVVIGVLVSTIFLSLLFNFKKIKKIKALPIIVLILLLGISIIIQYFYPNILLINSIFSLVTFIMYHTIENPDVKMVKQLNIAKEQAEKANNAKSEFLSAMSHEIRTPLNAIVGFSESLKEEELSPEAKEEVDDIIEASNALLETVNGILDISKIEANKIEIINGNYEFKKMFNELVALSKARLGESKPIDFRYHMAEDIPDILYGDSTRIRQVVLNFLTNAIKYTNEGYINFDVSCLKKDGICRLIFKVEDTGIGIKQESINRLFDKFDRLDNENSTIEGTGLGLAITKRLVDLMHGKIVVQSVYGKGSQFMVVIDQKIIEEHKAVVNEEVKEEVKEVKDYSSKKVLIVDDNTLNLKVAARLLKQYNLQVEEVDSGFKCLDLINNGNTYDLILMDDMMPKLSGVETLVKLKEINGFNIPVVILTANAIAGMKEKYLSEGFDDYLAKPIERGELDRIINTFLGK